MNNNRIWVKCSCDNVYKLLKRISQLGINIYGVKQKDNTPLICIDNRDYINLKKYLISYDFHIVRFGGIRYLYNVFIKNKIFIFSIMIGIVLFTFLNNVIVDIDIIHENPEIRNMLKEELALLGVKTPSIRKKYFELDRIRHIILNNHPDKLDWIEIETMGMKYVVHVEERLLPSSEEPNQYCNVYAKKSGLIDKIQLINGVSVVSLGDYVEEGDLLITGDIIHNEEVKSQVCASGQIWAKRWYQVDMVVPLNYSEYQQTGKYKWNIIYENDSFSKRILKARFLFFDTEKTKLMNLFSHQLSLEKELELKKIEHKYTEDEALNKALELAEEKIKLKLLEEESINDKKVLKKNVNDSTIEVVILIVTNEIIN